MKYNQDYNDRNQQTDMIYGEINTDTIDANSVCMGHLFGQRPTTYGEYTGVPPVTFTTSASKLTDWYIIGASAGVGDRTDNLFDEANYSYIEHCAFVSGFFRIAEPAIYNERLVIYIPIVGGQSYSFSIDSLYPGTSFQSVISINEPAIDTSYNIGGASTFIDHGEVSSFTRTTLPSANWLAIQIRFAQNVNNNMMINEGSMSLPFEPYGYKIPVICGGTTTNIYIGAPLTESDTITQTQTAIQIPTTPGTNTLSIDTTVQPSEIYIKYKE